MSAEGAIRHTERMRLNMNSIPSQPGRNAAPSQPAFGNLDGYPLPAFDLDLNGVIVDVNQAVCQLFQMKRKNLLGRCGWDFTVAEQVKFSREAFFACLQNPGEPEPIRRTLCDEHGAFHTCDMYRCFLRDDAGRRTGVRYAIVDVTQKQADDEDCSRSLSWTKSLLASLSEAVIASDPLGFIVYVNPAAERMIGWTAQELQGKPLEKTLPLLDEVTGDQAMIAIEAALDELASAATLMLDSEGRQIRVEISSAPWVDLETGSIAGVISVLRRLTPGG